MKKTQQRNIFLVGPMGAGKSSVGKLLASRLKMRFYDTDEEIEKRTGVDIGWIYDLEGEEGFRQREISVIQDLAKLSNIVLATGGGSVMTEENQAILSQNGIVVFLDVSLEYQHDRTVNESRRPMLRVENRQELLEKFHYERQPLYASLSDYRVLTDNRNVRAVVDDIVNWLGKK